VPRRSKLVVAIVLGVVAFVVVAGRRSQPADPGARLPESYRLVDLIARQQAVSAQLQREANQLQRAVDDQRRADAGSLGRASGVETALGSAALAAGLSPVHGPALRVTLDDSSLLKSPTGDLNDLVIHSQDVQGAVNALWHSGAQAIAVNGQRLVTTSAVLCVGNTLLLDGTVHSPPYVLVAIGATKATFDDDLLVRRLHHDADVVHLGFSVERLSDATVDGLARPANLKYAAVASP
jgi:uncharacterized protein YlxW (UPF0749 family)